MAKCSRLGRYVGAEDDDGPFEEKMNRLAAAQGASAQAAKLDKAIRANLKELGYGDE